MPEKRVAILLPVEVESINDTQAAFGPEGRDISDILRGSDFVEVTLERNRLSADVVEVRVTSSWQPLNE